MASRPYQLAQPSKTGPYQLAGDTRSSGRGLMHPVDSCFGAGFGGMRHGRRFGSGAAARVLGRHQAGREGDGEAFEGSGVVRES